MGPPVCIPVGLYSLHCDAGRMLEALHCSDSPLCGYVVINDMLFE
jgi:hypothetical protein